MADNIIQRSVPLNMTIYGSGNGQVVELWYVGVDSNFTPEEQCMVFYEPANSKIVTRDGVSISR